MKIEKGTLLRHYEIISQIGAGGMGEVYLADDPPEACPEGGTWQKGRAAALVL